MSRPWKVGLRTYKSYIRQKKPNREIFVGNIQHSQLKTMTHLCGCTFSEALLHLFTIRTYIVDAKLWRNVRSTDAKLWRNVRSKDAKLWRTVQSTDAKLWRTVRGTDALLKIPTPAGFLQRFLGTFDV